MFELTAQTSIHRIRPYKTTTNQQGNHHLEENTNTALLQINNLYKAKVTSTEAPKAKQHKADLPTMFKAK